MVYKGVMDRGSGEMDVAVKTLKEGSGGEDRVKFFQEAAIMGQFKHHNVVTIYGIITQGEPVSQARLMVSGPDNGARNIAG
jgi:serine/threonine protein kinase